MEPNASNKDIWDELNVDQVIQIGTFNEFSQEVSLIPVQNGSNQAKDKDWKNACTKKRPFYVEDFIERQLNGGFEVLNAAVALGPASGVFVVDVQDQNKFLKYRKANDFDSLPETFTVLSGDDSVHHYYEYPKNGTISGTKTYDGFTVHGIYSYVIAPDSIHNETKLPYRVISDIPVAEAPSWLLNLVLEPEEDSAQRSTLDRLNPMPKEPDSVLEDKKPASLTEIAVKMREMGFSFGAVLVALEADYVRRDQLPE